MNPKYDCTSTSEGIIYFKGIRWLIATPGFDFIKTRDFSSLNEHHKPATISWRKVFLCFYKRAFEY